MGKSSGLDRLREFLRRSGIEDRVVEFDRTTRTADDAAAAIGCTVAQIVKSLVVLSDGLWRRDFGAADDIVGRTVEINQHRLTVVGVAEAGFRGTTVVYDVEVFLPVMMAPQLGFTFGSRQSTPSEVLADRQAGLFFPQGYLRPGTTLGQAAEQVDALWAARAGERALSETTQRLRVVPFRNTPGGAPSFILPALGVLGAMGLLVLMIACANIAGLTLVRGLSRRGEIAVRLALGATRTRVMRLLMVENLVLAVPGAVLGVLLAWHGIPVLVGYAEWLAAPERVFFNIQVDGLVIGFAAAAACGSALLFGFVPALRSSRSDLIVALNEDASPRGAGRGRLRAGLVVTQVAVSLLLLVGAGLVTRSLEAARSARPGFDQRQVTAVAVDLKQNGYDEQSGRVFFRKLLDTARSRPGVESAALAAHIPMGLLDTPVQRVALDGYEPQPGEDLAFMSNVVAADYFRTLRIDLLAGREFDPRDDETTAPVALVNATLAQRFWGTVDDAVGKRLQVGGQEWRTVVGVVADVKYARVDEAPRPYFYLPLGQAYRSSMVLHTRGAAATPMARLVDQARRCVVALDAELPILFARPMAETTRGALLLFDLLATMLFVFGVAGMLLTAIGTYGLVAHTVEQSRHEIGIRIALGASGLSVVKAFLGRGLRLGTLGAGLGLGAALAASRLLSSLLYGVSATDGASFARAAALVMAGVLAASVVPAWRAARTNPLTTLRHQ